MYQSHESTILACTIVLSTFASNVLLDVSLHAYVYLCSRHTSHVHVCLSLHVTWLYFTYSLGCFLTTLRPACSDPDWEYSGLFRGDQSSVVKAWWISGWSFVALFFQPPLDRLLRFPFAAREHLSTFILCNFSCISYFCTLWWCNIHVILYHALW